MFCFNLDFPYDPNNPESRDYQFVKWMTRNKVRNVVQSMCSLKLVLSTLVLLIDSDVNTNIRTSYLHVFHRTVHT